MMMMELTPPPESTVADRHSRFTKDEMQRELLENMYRTDTLDELLKESDFTIRRRRECQQMVEALAKANEVVAEMQ
jgi:vacuolar protein sorting-associated protein 1